MVENELRFISFLFLFFIGYDLRLQCRSWDPDALSHVFVSFLFTFPSLSLLLFEHSQRKLGGEFMAQRVGWIWILRMSDFVTLFSEVNCH